MSRSGKTSTGKLVRKFIWLKEVRETRT
jgi:hypothetical protein